LNCAHKTTAGNFHRSNQGGVRPDKSHVADGGLGFVNAIAVAGDGAGADVDPAAHLAVADANIAAQAHLANEQGVGIYEHILSRSLCSCTSKHVASAKATSSRMSCCALTWLKWGGWLSSETYTPTSPSVVQIQGSGQL